jgi:hypothetical protein
LQINNNFCSHLLLEDVKEEREATAAVMPRKHSVGDGGSAAQKLALGALPDAVRHSPCYKEEFHTRCI